MVSIWSVYGHHICHCMVLFLPSTMWDESNALNKQHCAAISGHAFSECWRRWRCIGTSKWRRNTMADLFSLQRSWLFTRRKSQDKHGRLNLLINTVLLVVFEPFWTIYRRATLLFHVFSIPTKAVVMLPGRVWQSDLGIWGSGREIWVEDLDKCWWLIVINSD